MEIIEVLRSGSTLRIRLSGEFGHGEQNAVSGRLIEQCLQQCIERDTGELTEVVIDYAAVSGLGGDGPLWSVSPALRRKLTVNFIASGDTYNYLSELLISTRMNQLVHLKNAGVSESDRS